MQQPPVSQSTGGIQALQADTKCAHQRKSRACGRWKFDAVAAEKARAELDRQLAILEGHLSGRTFLVGQAITLADVIVAWSLLVPYLAVRHAGLPTLDWRRKGNCTGKLDMCMAMTMAIAKPLVLSIHVLPLGVPQPKDSLGMHFRCGLGAPRACVPLNYASKCYERFLAS